jgi:hypothetical protein
MPYYQAMAEEFNRQFSRKEIDQVPENLLEPGQDLAVAARTLGIAADAKQEGFLAILPPGIKEGLRAVLHRAVTDPQGRVPVQLVWAPGPVAEMRVWDVPGVAGSRGGISILLRTPLPGQG